eukprot:UN12330
MYDLLLFTYQYMSENCKIPEFPDINILPERSNSNSHIKSEDDPPANQNNIEIQNPNNNLNQPLHEQESQL